MLRKSNVFSVISLFGILLLITSLTFPNVNATVVWEDNFDDGNYDGWTVESGEFEVTNNVLNVTGWGSYPDLGWYNSIYHSSSIVTGTWSFDLWIGKDIHFHLWTSRPLEIQFIATKTDFFDQTGYSFGSWHDNGSELETFALYKLIEGEGTLPVKQCGGFYVGWHHIDITRNSTGCIKVYFNGTRLLQYVDTEYQSSSYFIFGACLNWWAIDNVVISDTIDIEEPTPTESTPTPTLTPTPTPTTTTSPPPSVIPPELLVIVIGVPVLLIIVLVVWKVRK